MPTQKALTFLGHFIFDTSSYFADAGTPFSCCCYLPGGYYSPLFYNQCIRYIAAVASIEMNDISAGRIVFQLIGGLPGRDVNRTHTAFINGFYLHIDGIAISRFDEPVNLSAAIVYLEADTNRCVIDMPHGGDRHIGDLYTILIRGCLFTTGSEGHYSCQQ